MQFGLVFIQKTHGSKPHFLAILMVDFFENATSWIRVNTETDHFWKQLCHSREVQTTTRNNNHVGQQTCAQSWMVVNTTKAFLSFFFGVSGLRYQGVV